MYMENRAEAGGRPVPSICRSYPGEGSKDTTGQYEDGLSIDQNKRPYSLTI